LRQRLSAFRSASSQDPSQADHRGQFVLRLGDRGVIIRAVVIDLKLQPFKLGAQIGLALVRCHRRTTDVG
jgi:hypothetical protein